MPSKPKLGQNFLNDETAIQRIANALGDLSERTVVETIPAGVPRSKALADSIRKIGVIH